MILGVNGIRLLGQRSGVGRCIEGLLKSFDEVEHPFSELRVYTPSPLPDDVTLPSVARSVVVKSALPHSLWEQIALPRAHGSQDLLLCPSYVSPWAARCPTLLIHHGSYEGYPEAFDWWTRTRARAIYALSAHLATRVTTVSERSRSDIARFYRVSPDKVAVIPNGVDIELFRPPEDEGAASDWRRRTLGEDVPFLLYVGKPTPRRNLPQLIEAFSQLKGSGGAYRDYKLVLAGVDLQASGLARDAERLGVRAHVIGFPHWPHEEVARAYGAAALFVYPSSYEGFGMPVLEAMACGTPVITLDNTAFPEFAGGVAQLLPNARVETLAAGIERVLSDPALREKMARAGPARAADYAWPIIARQYVELMTDIVGRRPSHDSGR